MLPDSEIIEEIAIELGVDPSFVEKDWYAVQVIRAISTFSSNDITPVFSGGTSLSKGYGLLKRFSEDLDFRAWFHSEKQPNKSERRSFRNGIFDAVRSVEGIGLDEEGMNAGSNYFKVSLTYPYQFELSSALRPMLQLEFSYTQPRQEALLRPVSSFISEFVNHSIDAEIFCLSPIETAADKLSALIWRVLKRDRATSGDDPAMIRHLHDLCALSTVVKQDADAFKQTALESFDGDMSTKVRNLDGNLLNSGMETLNILKTDHEYSKEYEQFVAGMSYAEESEIDSFDEAIRQLQKLVELFE